jgi:GMP synthase (glutamine-hydrolysing)
VDVLAVIHGEAVRAGVFADAIAERGHRLEEWSLAWDRPLPQPLDAYGAVVVFGGAMHADQDDRHPWLREETMFLERLFDLGVPMLGVCLGAQLLARAAHAPVFPASEPEIGWHEVELTPAAEDDAVLGWLPPRFDAFQWHYYTHGVPAGADELARSSVCTQAFRLGERVWGVQFHPEVTLAQVESWVAEEPAAADGDRLLAETRERIEAWNDLGRRLCGAFVEAAERVAAPA